MPQIDVAAGVSEPLVATLPRALKPRHSYSDSFAPTQLAPSISALAVRASPFRNNSILLEILYTNKGGKRRRAGNPAGSGRKIPIYYIFEIIIF